MQRGTKEFYDIQAHFEKTAANIPGYFTLDFSKAEKESKTATVYYNNGQVNAMFNAYLSGYSLAKAVHQ